MMKLSAGKTWVGPLTILAALSMCVQSADPGDEHRSWMSADVVRPVSATDARALEGFEIHGDHTDYTIGPLELVTDDGSLIELAAATPVNGDCELLRIPRSRSAPCWLLIGFDAEDHPRIRVLEDSGDDSLLFIEGMGASSDETVIIDGFVLEPAASLYVRCADADSFTEWRALGRVPDSVAYIDAASGRVTSLGCAEQT